MIVRLIKVGISALVWIADAMGAIARSLTGRSLPGRCVILYYHAVNASERARFAAQMEMLKRCAVTVPATGETSQKPGERYAAVTFDDGFVSVIEHALPELESRNIPWTFFVPTGSWGRRPGWVHDRDARPYNQVVLTTDQLRRLGDQASITIGAHSVTHPDFLTLTEAQVRHELVQSKTELENILGRDVTLFSFPHGRYDASAVEQARAAGYRRVFTIAPTWAFAEADEFVTGRVAVEPGDWPLEFWLKLRGAYRWQATVTGWKQQSARASATHASMARQA